MGQTATAKARVNAIIEEVQVEHSSEPKHAGVEFPKYFTARLEAGKTPYDDVQWETRTATIGNDKGSVIFEQRDIEVPADWSQTATFAQFLPSLRTPQSIDVGLTADTTGSISVEIPDTAPSRSSYRSPATSPC